MEIKKLEKSFIGRGEVRGFEFKRLFESPKAYLYEVNNSSGGLYYEVFKKRINSRYATETYPSAKQFGKTAWTTKDLNKAKSIFNNLTNN